MNFAELIGVPFEYGGRGPDIYDCYGLLRFLYQEMNGVEIPDYQSPQDGSGAKITAIFASEIRLWQETELTEGTVLLFRVPGNLHVGMYIGNGRFIHTWEQSGGVAIEHLSEWKPRLMGVYKYVG